MNTTFLPLDDPRRNQLLGALSPADWECWLPQLEPMKLIAGQVLCEAGCTPTHMVFPTTAIVSLMVMTQDGGSAEIGVVGNDGVVGISLFMGGSAASSQAVVQSSGQGYRMRASLLTSDAQRSAAALKVLLRYTQALISQVAQTALCNRFHSIDQQLCRRLLLGLDRLPTDELLMTQEAAANLLGVRREGVTCAAHKLQLAGVIRYNRGHIAVLDRAGLEQRTCECYAVARKEYERLLPLQMHMHTPMPRPVPQPIPRPMPMPMPMPTPKPVHAPAAPVSAWRSSVARFNERRVAAGVT